MIMMAFVQCGLSRYFSSFRLCCCDLFFTFQQGVVGLYCYQEHIDQGYCVVIIQLGTGMCCHIDHYGVVSLIVGCTLDFGVACLAYHRFANRIGHLWVVFIVDFRMALLNVMCMHGLKWLYHIAGLKYISQPLYKHFKGMIFGQISHSEIGTLY